MIGVGVALATHDERARAHAAGNDAQVALARAFRPGDFRSGYYRDQTLMMALGLLTLEQVFAQLYADPDIERAQPTWSPDGSRVAWTERRDNQETFLMLSAADGADIAAIRKLAAEPLIAGFTTNPTLMRKAQVDDYEQFAHEFLECVPDRPISFEVFSDEFDEMERQARKIAGWGDNVYVKIPITNTEGVSSLDLVRRPLTERNLLRMLLRYPLVYLTGHLPVRFSAAERECSLALADAERAWRSLGDQL